MRTNKIIISGQVISFFLIFVIIGCGNSVQQKDVKTDSVKTKAEATASTLNSQAGPLDTARYNQLLAYLANNDTTGKWPAKFVYPLPGAILPFHRIVAFYGNLYSKRMGILGELPKAEMLDKLKKEVAMWQAADSTIPVIPALHYVAVTAQGSPGKDGKHRMRMPDSQMDSMVNWAKEINALVFLDIQVGHSSVAAEVPPLEKYLQLPQVHLGIDPEFSMKTGNVPGTKIGTFDAADINVAIDH
ncbi:MAG: hypothetical protein ABIR31_10370, partial [Ginsengibacter sp.]